MNRFPPLSADTVGVSSPFYWTSGANRTDASLATQQAILHGWNGYDFKIWRTGVLDATEVNKSWAEDAFANIYASLKTRGCHIAVTADQLQLQDGGWTETLSLAHVETILAGRTAAGLNTRTIIAIGNEPYVGATGTHAELDATLASRAIALSKSIKAAWPGVQTCMPALGTFQMGSEGASETELDSQWAAFVALFQGHDTFDFASANCYRLTGSGANTLITYGINSLISNAATLNVAPLVTEIGVVSPSASDIASVLSVSSAVPRVVWSIGSGDTFDLLTTGAAVPPETI